MILRFILTSVALATSWSASAQQAVSQAVPSLPDSSVSFAGLLQALLGLLIVLAFIAALAWLFRRLPLGQGMAGGVVRVVGGVALGTRERLVLVEVGETWLLLGVAPGQVNTLHTMPRPANVGTEGGMPGDQGFAAWLKQAMHKRSAT
jgi:flagellar protein FliO/FliZ